MSDLPSICQHVTSTKTGHEHTSLCQYFCRLSLVLSATTGQTTARLMKSGDAAGVPSENKETEVKPGVRFPKQTLFCEALLV